MAGGSNWNAWHDRLLAAPKLTPNEALLATALARIILGWNLTEERLGGKLIRATAGNMHGRSFERARDGLVEKGLLRYVPGSVGRGNRGTYSLLLLDTEKTAVAREFETVEKTAVAREFRKTIKDRVPDTEKTAVPRTRKGRKGKNTATSAASERTLHQRAFETYLAAGGSNELDRAGRGALASSVKSAASNGATDEEILAAIGDLGRTGDFPGYLKQRLSELQEQGGACAWPALDRSKLTHEQLETCHCNRCAEWSAALQGEKRANDVAAAAANAREPEPEEPEPARSEEPARPPSVLDPLLDAMRGRPRP